jgi:chromosome segregation ATPase
LRFLQRTAPSASQNLPAERKSRQIRRRGVGHAPCSEIVGKDDGIVVPIDQERHMSDEHLERIEAKLDRVITTQAEHGLTLDQHTAKLDDHSRRFERWDSRVAGVDRTLGRQDTRLSAVEVSLETTVPQAIKQIAEGHAMLQGSMDRGFAEIKEHIDRRVDPLEEAMRQHSATLKTLTAGPQKTST